MSAPPRHTQGRLSLLLLVVATLVGPQADLSARSGLHPMADQQPATADILMLQMRAAVAATVATLPQPEARDLARLYEHTTGRPAWLSIDGRPNATVRTAIDMLAAAAADGLRTSDYHVAPLATRFDRIATATTAEVAQFDVQLSTAALRFYRHLHLGRIQPSTLGLSLDRSNDDHNFADLLFQALERGDVVDTARRLVPSLAQYRLLREQLARYRRLAGVVAPAPAFAATLRPGESATNLASLHQLLVAVGDLPETTPAPGLIYDEPLAEGVRRFQMRHGLNVDGVIGRVTQAALAVPLSWRVRQIELALERLRWVPDLTTRRVIAVNIPMFRLWAWDTVTPGTMPALSMKVVVGRALNTQTPVFTDQMEYVVFRPYWNVPTSILRNEMIPALQRDPDYLRRQNLEIVRGPGDTSPVVPPTPDHLSRLGRDGLRLRQRPGPSNALGLVKFMFPNENNVYMHDTPAPQVFAQARRDFSHGCIRVEEPERLAEWVLADLGTWPRHHIQAAMAGTPNRRVDLPEPIQVVLFYTTVIVQPEDGAVHFADDIYKHDARLHTVMAR
jgi:L,D-transpeptidase YcbB